MQLHGKNKMAHIVVYFLFPILFPLLTMSAPSDTSDGQLLPLDRMEKAYILYNLWKQWYSNEPWDDSNQITDADVDKPCDLEAADTLRVMYFLRIKLTVDKGILGLEGKKNADKMIEYEMIQHIAKHISFYEENLGSPSLRDSNLFCSVGQNAFEAVKEQGQFFWPPDPYPVVCDPETKKYAKCSDITSSTKANEDLKKACSLIVPPEEAFEGPSPGQLYLSELKNRIQYRNKKYNPGKAEIQYEGGNCTAAPWKSIGYIALNTVLNVKSPGNVQTYDEYEEAIEGVRVLDSDLVQWKKTLDNITRYDLLNLEYCKYDSPNSGKNHTGGLICGGTTCKLCKEYPRDNDMLQRWNYETGPLHKACALTTKLTTNNDDRPPDLPPKEKCPSIDNNCHSSDPCDDYPKPEKPVHIEYKTNADRWRKFANKATETREINYWVVSILSSLVFIAGT